MNASVQAFAEPPPPEMQPGEIGLRMLQFDAAAEGCGTMEDLADLASRSIALAGMTVISSGMLTGPALIGDDVFHFHVWPEEWQRIYDESGCLEHDPVLRWTIVSGAPARWTTVMALLPPNDPAYEVARVVHGFGLLEGVITPVRTQEGHLGMVSVGGPRAAITDAEFHFLHFISAIILRRAETLARPVATRPAPRLSRRESECVALLTHGLTEREMAAFLGISETTTRFHLDNAKLKTGARSRTHLAGIAGLWLGRAQLGKLKRVASPSRESRPNGITPRQRRQSRLTE